MKSKIPSDHNKYLEYDFENRITYDESSDSMYIYVAPPQGAVGAVMVYNDDNGGMVSIDTDEVNTQIGIEEYANTNRRIGECREANTLI